MLSWSSPSVPLLPGLGPSPRIFDSTSRQIVDAAAAQPGGGSAGIYVCGITPYDATHLGHAATYVAFDLLVRAWRDAGIEVRHVQNVTDIDDPLLERAANLGVDWRELAASQTELFATDMVALRVIPPMAYIGAVESIDRVVTAVEKLLADGHAYRVPNEPAVEGDLGDVYLDLSTDPAVGTVAGLSREVMLELAAERGGDPQRPGKRDPLDPLLWRTERPGEPSWPGGSLGDGRPGWHIECAVIALDHLDGSFDVQGGGNDLLFPHHEMSTGHVRQLQGPQAAPRRHVHAGMIAYQGEKMSKSLGNLVLVSQLRERGVDPMAIRLALLAGHYRADREWHDSDLADAEQRLARWREATQMTSGNDATELIAQIRAALANDLDSPAALAAIDAWVDSQLRAPGAVAGSPALVHDAVDALLGVAL